MAPNHPAGAPEGRRNPVMLSSDNILEFLETFDTVLCDCDGVLWGLTPVPYENSDKCVQVLETEWNKRIFFVSNNSIRNRSHQLENFKKMGIKCTAEQLVFPAIAIADYLKTIGFQKEAIVLGTTGFKDTLREAGIAVTPRVEGYPLKEEVFVELAKVLMRPVPEVGAVIVDADFNLNFIELNRAARALEKNPDCLFLVAATEGPLKLPNGLNILGPAQFTRILEEMSGLTPVAFGKPEPTMVQYIQRNYHIDPERTLFIGDSLKQDMGVAAAAGLKSLLVLTGQTVLEDLETCSDALMPHYVAPSLGHIVTYLSERQGGTGGSGSGKA